jgi:hypothetical protein
MNAAEALKVQGERRSPMLRRSAASRCKLDDEIQVGEGGTTWKTMDYIKRGMDDVVEGYRDPC